MLNKSHNLGYLISFLNLESLCESISWQRRSLLQKANGAHACQGLRFSQWKPWVIKHYCDIIVSKPESLLLMICLQYLGKNKIAVEKSHRGVRRLPRIETNSNIKEP